MATRYWVGGAGTWDNASTTNWSTVSGGGGGASAPTAADIVVFDNNSNVGTGTFIVTVGTTALCLDMTFGSGATALDGAMTLAFGTTGVLTVSGSWTNPATNFSTTGTGPNAGAIVFNATTTGKTITTNGVTITANILINGTGGVWTLGSALTGTGNVGFVFSAGTFDTGGYNMTVTSFQGTGTKTINLNNSTITTTGTSFGWSMTSLTVNAGTSQINSPPTTTAWQGNGQTYYNVVFTGNQTSTQPISGANTFNNLTFPSRTSLGINIFTFAANQTINGTLTLNAGTAAAYRTMLASDTIGTQRTLTCATISGGTDYDFQDIAIAGAASPISPTRAGDCKGNSGITFPATKTVYYRQAGSANWGATGSGSWSATSGGALDATMFPLAQDTAVFPVSPTPYPTSGNTVTINANYNIGTIDMSLRTSNTMTLTTGTNSPTIYGNWINGTGITISGSGTITFAGRTTQTITSAGKSFTQSITINSPSGIFQLQDAFTTGTTVTTTLTQGTLDLQSYTLSAGLFSSSNSNTRTIAFGTGNITCTNTTIPFTVQTITNLSVTGSRTVNITYSGASVMTVYSGLATEAQALDFNFTGGTYSLTFLAINGAAARNIDFTGYAGTWTAISPNVKVFGNLKISTGMTLTASANALTFSATSGTKQITTNGRTLDFPITFNGVGGTFQLQDALTMGSTRDATLANGTLDLNGKTMTVGTSFATAAGTKNLTFNGGTLVCPAASAFAFNNVQSGNFTTIAGTGTGTISMTAATAKSFVGGSSIYNCTLNQGGIGTLTVTGSNTFNNLTNTVYLTTVLFTGGTTNKFTSFNLTGILANVVTLGSTSATKANLQKGSTWYMGANSTDGGNNTGLTFSAGGGIDYLSVSYINGTVVSSYYGGGNFFNFF